MSESRPWGSFEILASGCGYKVKRITVRPRSRLSYQVHRHRLEHWVIVEGVGFVTLDEVQHRVVAGDRVTVPAGVPHRLANDLVTTSLTLVEVQVGTYLGEDDIERLDDDYGRAGSVS